MKILVTGATGTLGRPAVARLLEAGHGVVALSRSDESDARIREIGALPVRGEIFERAAMDAALRGVDAVAHLATRIPPLNRASRPEAWADNDRIRTLGTKVLVDAALAAGVGAFVYPSVSFFYPDRGDAWMENETPRDVARPLRSTLDAEAEVRRLAESGGRGIVLRNGAFYGVDAPNTSDTVAAARRGVALVIGRGDAYASQIWVGDAATAVAAAVERAPSGIYDVVDDAPIPRRELRAAMARAVGRRRLVSPPLWLVRMLAGKDALFAARSQRISNRRFREATGWAPAVRDAREGWDRIAAALRG